MKLLSFNQPLYAPVNDDGVAGGAGTGSPAAFDQAAFTATILGEVSKTLAAFGKSFKADLAKQAAVKPPAVTPPSDPDPVLDATIDPAATTDKAKPDAALQARLQLMEKKNREQAAQFSTQLETMQKQTAERDAAAELRERHTAIREELANPAMQFGSQAQRDTAFRIFSGDIRRLEDGSLVGGAADLPLKEYIGETMKAHQYLLAPKDAGGSGARNGKAPGAGKSIDFDSIKPGMSVADANAAAAQISAVLAQH